MSFSLTGQQIKDTYQRLAQVSASRLVDGLGNDTTGLLVSSASLAVLATNATNATSSSFATTSSYAGSVVSASYALDSRASLSSLLTYRLLYSSSVVTVDISSPSSGSTYVLIDAATTLFVWNGDTWKSASLA